MSVLSAFRVIGTSVLGEVVGPSRCAACDLGVPANVLFCPACAASVEHVDPSDARAGFIAAFEYGGAMATAIMRLKYEDRADLGPRLGRALVGAAARVADEVDLVIPIPIHPRRLAERGYNQAALLAGPIAHFLRVRMAPCALARVRDTTKQTSLDRAARLSNVHRAFCTRERKHVNGARVLLVDDVRTTGATLEGCSTALLEAGARQVISLVLARRG